MTALQRGLAGAKGFARPRRHLPLNPWKAGPKIYWDLVGQAADNQPACYFALAIRTDTPGSVTQERYRQLLEYLPNHPVAKRLQFVDPLGPEIRALATPEGINSRVSR